MAGERERHTRVVRAAIGDDESIAFAHGCRQRDPAREDVVFETRAAEDAVKTGL